MVTWAEETALPDGGAVPTGTLGKGLTKARAVSPQLSYSCTFRRGRNRRPKAGSCWNWPQAWKPLKAFEEAGRSSGLKNKTIWLSTRCWTQFFPQVVLIMRWQGRESGGNTQGELAA